MRRFRKSVSLANIPCVRARVCGWGMGGESKRTANVERLEGGLQILLRGTRRAWKQTRTNQKIGHN